MQSQDEKLVQEEDRMTHNRCNANESEEPSENASACVEPTPEASNLRECDEVNDSDGTNSDHEIEPSSAPSSSDSIAREQVQEQEEPVDDVRRLIARGLSQLTRHERIQIDEEVHGVSYLGLSLEEEAKPHVQGHFLNQFQDVLDAVLSGSSIISKASTVAYELCMEKNYLYATNESGELRLMCLRAELWDPSRACERFLNHLTALLKYYGEEGLIHPLTINQLDRDESAKTNKMSKTIDDLSCNDAINKAPRKQGKKRKTSEQPRRIYKKGKGGSKRKGSLDSLPDMLALKTGSIQVLPSRDRSGRRVVVLQPGPSIANSLQNQKQVQHSKFKAMLYFLSVFVRRDVEAQRKGFVLILNSTKTDETHNEKEYGYELLQQYEELYRSIPVRICALHFSFDKDSTNSIPHKICRTILESFIENNPKMNTARVQLYDHDVSNDSTKQKIAPFGVPIHQIPVTHTGTIKLKEHNGWVKIQEWYDKKSEHGCFRTQQSNFNVIECPSTNDVLFSQGGKYWNGVNRFQRGNLEFMEFLEGKIDLYQSTLSWKKKHTIIGDMVAEFASIPQRTGKNARFLETATQIEGVSAPDGCWVELPLTSPLLSQKIRQTLLNHIRRLESSGKRRPAPTKAVRAKKDKKASRKAKKEDQAPLASQEKREAEKTKKNIKIAKEIPSNKKQKITPNSSLKPRLFHHSSPPVMKNNKLAIATFGNSIHSSIHGNYNGSNHETSLIHKQAICEFLANAERIAVSTAAVDIACEDGENNLEDGSLQDAIANDEKLVQAIIANDDRLNKEVGELFEIDSFLRDEEDVGDVEPDEIADCLMGCML